MPGWLCMRTLWSFKKTFPIKILKKFYLKVSMLIQNNGWKQNIKDKKRQQLTVIALVMSFINFIVVP